MLKTRKGLLTDVGHGTDEEGNTWMVGRIGDEQVALLVLHPLKNGERSVLQVWTDKPYRRQGVATQLWEAAKRLGLNPVHDSHRTPDGTEWAKAVGD